MILIRNGFILSMFLGFHVLCLFLDFCFITVAHDNRWNSKASETERANFTSQRL